MEEDEVQIVTPDSETAGAVEDKPESSPTDDKSGNIVSYIEKRFTRSETARHFDEQRWLRAYRNYRGIYGPDVQFTEAEKSKVFVKVTKTKVLAAYGQITEVLFGSNKFPISIEPTSMPEGIAEAVHFDTQQNQEPQGMPELQPGDTMQTLLERTGSLKDKLEPVGDKLKSGPGTTPTAVTYHPAMVAAKKMEKKIHDQLEEASANKQLRSAAFECAQFGTGILKGPFAVDKEYPDWDDDGEYKPIIKLVPSTDYVSIFNFYPDPDADSMEDAEYVVERHKLSRSKLRQLKSRPYFRKNAVDAAIGLGENYVEKWWEHQIEEEESASSVERFEVLEYWGYVDVETLQEHNIKVPRNLIKLEQVSINAWICNGQLLRLVMNPYQPSYIPYHAFPYEVNPYSFFGIGVAENMDDTQTLMNGFMRMAVDNAALSGNLIIEVDETNLVPGQDSKVYPGRVFRREGGAPGQSIFGTKFPNVANENMQLFDKARVLADESTGLPSYSHGQTGIMGVGRTSSGISMFMNAAAGTIRTVVKNIDDYLLSPLGKYMYYFNMQFDKDEEIKGDLEVKARGTESLMANEVRSQRLMQFLSIVLNPMTAPFAKLDYILREIAVSLDLDPEKVTNNLADAALQAEMMRQNNPVPLEQLPSGSTGAAMAQQQAGGVGGTGEGAPPVSDTSGGGAGNIGIGSVPVPGQDGFSGN